MPLRTVQFMQRYNKKMTEDRPMPAGIKTFCLFLAIALIPCLLIAFGLHFPKAKQAMVEKKDILPIYSVETKEKKAALTFDVAWEGTDIPTLLDILHASGIKATFFVVGDFARAHPDMVQAMEKAGHEIANHSDRHPHPLSLSQEALQKDARACDRLLRSIGVHPVPYYRAPYGEYNQTVIAAMLQMELQPIQWSVDSLDWKNKAPEEMEKRVVERTKPGDILLFHTGKENTKKALPGILTGLRKKGLKLCPVSELLWNEPFYLDHEGRQHPYH